jgi:uncharacterized protein YjbI with pentapeptide repeats
MAELTREELLHRARRGDRLDRADLDGANLEGVDLSNVSLRRASLREAYLVGANLAGANLENADLEGAQLERACLAKANLTRANLEGAVLTGADLSGARLSYSQLASAKLGGANLTGAVLTHAELDDAYLGGVAAEGAQFTSASLVTATLDEATLAGANLDDAALRGASARGADLSNASLVKADLGDADLSNASLRGADLRHATATGAQLGGATLTGARVAGLVTGGGAHGVEAAWLDASAAGDGSHRIEGDDVAATLTGRRAAPPSDGGTRRYFGQGDILRNATLQFDSGARVEIDSLFQNCTINLGDGTELVIGSVGVLADCEIAGAGKITIHGKFFERQSPGIIGPRQLMVSSQGAVVSAVAQHDDQTRFSFEKGCQLRMKVVQPLTGKQIEKVEAKP